jgi:curli biogenesis system outer membrane secretion channel CsgG
MKTLIACATILTLLLVCPTLRGQDKTQAQNQPDAGLISIAVLDFQAKDRANDELGAEVAVIVSAMLSTNDQFQLVERENLEKILDEAELNLTGLVDSDQAIRIGKLTSAQVIVVGRMFNLGQKNFVTAKLIGTETSRVKAVSVSGDVNDDIGELALMLAEKLNEELLASGDQIVGKTPVVEDRLPELVKRLAKIKDKPTLAVIVTEEHIPGPRPLEQAIDPAVETELKKHLSDAGFDIKDVKENELAEWAAQYDNGAAWPRSLDGVDIVVTGEAFSQFALRIRNLVSCTARAEINVISRKEGKIILADRATSRAIDLAEHISGKTALQKSGYTLSTRLLEKLEKLE